MRQLVVLLAIVGVVLVVTRSVRGAVGVGLFVVVQAVLWEKTTGTGSWVPALRRRRDR